MMNQDNPYAMNQTCKVCGEPAAGFHFGAFTCEGCKSFFGRSYNNLSSISDCKNNGECIINKKNRTACKACRLRKCLMVGMSKSGSRYGRRSNWFKIHCLLQEQQQQAAAAMAAHHNSQQQHQAAAAAAAAAHGLPGQKPPSVVGVPPPAAAVAALGMLGHAGAYPGLYPPRTKEELMMLGLEEYAKHPAASPSVSSPDSHNSDSSVEVNVRGNALLHLSGKHAEATAVVTPQLRKDLPPFLPLPFPGLGSMPVMPPPAFLPPPHLLFPGYHPALYQPHQGLLKPSPEQQQQAVAAAAAVQHLFNSAPNRFVPTAASTATSIAATATQNSLAALPMPPQRSLEPDERTAASPKSSCISTTPLSNNHIPNGSNAANELTKRFYLDAVLKSQRSSPPPPTTKLPTHSKHDHSISALVTPNSESGRERLKSRQSNEEEDEAEQECNDVAVTATHNNDSDCTGDEEEEVDLVVSMTPPRSPAQRNGNSETPPQRPAHGQDNPIDLSMKTGSSESSSLSSKCSSNGSVHAIDSENEQEAEAVESNDVQRSSYTSGSTRTHESANNGEVINIKVTEGADNTEGNLCEKLDVAELAKSNNVHNNNNNNNNNEDALEISLDNVKRKADVISNAAADAQLTRTTAIESTLAATASVKRLKLDLEPLEKNNVKLGGGATTTPLDLTTKV